MESLTRFENIASSLFGIRSVRHCAIRSDEPETVLMRKRRESEGERAPGFFS
jgi:hypothetical protein